MPNSVTIIYDQIYLQRLHQLIKQNMNLFDKNQKVFSLKAVISVQKYECKETNNVLPMIPMKSS